MQKGEHNEENMKMFMDNCISYRSLTYIDSFEVALFELIYRRLRSNNHVQKSSINSQFERGGEFIQQKIEQFYNQR